MIRERVSPFLEELSAEIGIRLTLGGATFARNGSDGTFKLEMAAVDASGEVFDPEKEALIRIAPALGIPVETLFEPFSSGGRRYVLKGYNARASRFPFIADELASGETYKLGEYMVFSAKKAA